MSRVSRSVLLAITVVVIVVAMAIYSSGLANVPSRRGPFPNPEEFEGKVKYLVVLYRATDGEILSYSVSTVSFGGICPGPEEDPGPYSIAFYLLPEDLRSGDLVEELHASGGMKVIDPATGLLKLGEHTIEPYRYMAPGEAYTYCNPWSLES